MLIHLKRMKLWLFVKPYVLNEKLIIKKALKIKKFVDFRSSHRSCSVEKGALKNSANFTGKHLCWSLFLKKCWPFQLHKFIKKRLRHCYFPVKFENLLRTLTLKIICERPTTSLIWNMAHEYSITLSFMDKLYLHNYNFNFLKFLVMFHYVLWETKCIQF